MADVLLRIKGFEWDKGNSGKNDRKHGVIDREAEEIFFNKPLAVARSSKGGPEIRYAALKKLTEAGF
jgi:uncharacterized protein